MADMPMCETAKAEVHRPISSSVCDKYNNNGDVCFFFVRFVINCNEEASLTGGWNLLLGQGRLILEVEEKAATKNMHGTKKKKQGDVVLWRRTLMVDPIRRPGVVIASCLLVGG